MVKGKGALHRREIVMLMLARLVKFVTGVVVALLVAGILVHVLGANTANGLVNAVDDAARWLATPFKGVFTPEGKDARKSRFAITPPTME